MASQTSASASRQVLPLSLMTMAESSSRRARMVAAARTSMSARSALGMSRQRGNAASAAATARAASVTVESFATLGTAVDAMAARYASRTEEMEKFRIGSVKNGRPSPTPAAAQERVWRSGARRMRSTPGSESCSRNGLATSDETSALSRKPAFSQLSLEVFSSRRRTRYAMPGIISPTGTYSRTRRPMVMAAALSGSPMPWSICSSIADFGSPCFSSVASAAAMERALCEPSASFTPPSPILRGVFSMKYCATRSKHASVSHLRLHTGTGHPCCSAWMVS